MTEARHPFGGAGDQRRPQLRSDLTIVADTAGNGGMRIVDPRNGKQYSFDRDEQALCRAADGSADISAIHSRHRAAGGGLSEDQVARFFRRLHVLGLLKPSLAEPEGDDPATPVAGGLMAKRREERADPPAKAPSRRPMLQPGRDGGLMARRRLARGNAPAGGTDDAGNSGPAEGGHPDGENAADKGIRGRGAGGMRARLAGRAAPKGDGSAERHALLARRRREADATSNEDAGADPVRPPAGLGAARHRRRAFGATLAATAAASANDPTPASRELRARRREMIEKARSAQLSGETAEPTASAARDLLARRRAEKAAKNAPTSPAATREPDATPPRAGADTQAARDLLARRRQEREAKIAPSEPEASPASDAATQAASPTATPRTARDPLAKRRSEVLAGDATAASEAAPMPLPGAPAITPDAFAKADSAAPRIDPKNLPRDLLAARRAELSDGTSAGGSAPPVAPRPSGAGEDDTPATTDAATETPTARPDEEFGRRTTAPESPAPTTAQATSDTGTTAASVRPPASDSGARDSEQKQDEAESPHQPGVSTPPQPAASEDAAAEAEQAEKEAEAPHDLPKEGPRPPEETSPAKAAMAAAQKAATSGKPARAASPRATAPKKPPRNSDLMVRRLRERGGRGIAPETGKPPKPADEEAATRTPPPRPYVAPDLDFDFLEDDDMGGMGAGGMGGMRGGMMGGGVGGMRGGMGAGGMGAGMGPMGAMGAGMGGMRGGMMGGGMGAGMGAMRGGMAGAAQAGKPPQKMRGQLPLFNPQPFLRLLYVLFYPLKYVLWAIVPLVALGFLTAINNITPMMTDLGRIASNYNSITHLLISMFGVSLIARLAQGVAVVAHGGQVKVFALMLALGILPRFTIDRNGIDTLDRRGQLWAHGAPMLARLLVFSVGIIAWAMTREGGGVLPDISLVLAQFGLVVFLLTAWPLFVSDGQRWVALMLNEPKLVGKAALALRYVFKGGDLPQALSRKDVWPLALFALGTLLTLVVLTGGAIAVSATILVGELAGLGFVLFLGGLAAFVLWFMALLSSRRRSNGAFDAEGFRKMAQVRGMDFAEEPAKDDLAGREALLPSRAKVVWALILCGLLAVAFLPYDYETGGDVEILPFARGQAIARTDGEIVEILVQEGDSVERGEALAQLSSWNQQANIQSTEALLDGARAELARMEAGATAEEIDLARKQLESAEASVAFTQAEADRQTDLAKTGVVSQASLEKALSNLEIDLADLEVARANYNNVVAPATEEDLAIRRSDVRRYEEQLAFQRDELDRTKVVAPIDGRVVTKDLQLKQGSYLRAGDVFLEIERTDRVTATILVTESDIGLIEPGDVVRLKTSGQSSQQTLGTVDAIAPSASEEAGYGRAIRVTASFDNSDGFLRSGMTGYAKIDGEEMRVWEAYLRSIRHFFQIEVWSWIP